MSASPGAGAPPALAQERAPARIEVPTASLRFAALAWAPAGALDVADPRARAAPLALLLHGFPDDPGSWAPVAERLAAAGVRCVAPWLRGYGPTGPPPDGDLGAGALGRDALALVDALTAPPDGRAEDAPAGGEPAEESVGRAPSPRVVLVGHDWGAVAAYAGAAQDEAERRSGRAGRRARDLALVAVAVPPPRVLLANLPRDPRQLARSAYMLRMQLPGAARWLRADDMAAIDRLWAAWSPGWTPPPGRLAEVKRTLAAPGTLEAVVATYRALRPLLTGPVPAPFPRGARDRAALLLPVGAPATVVHGLRDGCLGPACFEGLARGLTGPLEQVSLPDVGHFVPLEAPEALAAAVLRRLGRAP